MGSEGLKNVSLDVHILRNSFGHKSKQMHIPRASIQQLVESIYMFYYFAKS